MRSVHVYVLLTCLPAIILSRNTFCSNIYHKANNYIHYPGIIWKPVLFPSKWFLCVRRVLGRERQDRCHYLTMVTRWCASTTVMLWSCSYETWRTNLAEGLFISFCGAVCALWHTSLPVPQPGLVRVQPGCRYLSPAFSSLVCSERLLEIFMCSWNWFHMRWGQSADSLIKLNRESGKRRQRLYWSLIQ